MKINIKMCVAALTLGTTLALADSMGPATSENLGDFDKDLRAGSVSSVAAESVRSQHEAARNTNNEKGEGNDGKHGQNGKHGQSGEHDQNQAGTPWNSLPSNAPAGAIGAIGANGQEGQHGQNGQHGQHGQNGQHEGSNNDKK